MPGHACPEQQVPKLQIEIHEPLALKPRAVGHWLSKPGAGSLWLCQSSPHAWETLEPGIAKPSSFSPIHDPYVTRAEEPEADQI